MAYELRQERLVVPPEIVAAQIPVLTNKEAVRQGEVLIVKKDAKLKKGGANEREGLEGRGQKDRRSGGPRPGYDGEAPREAAEGGRCVRKRGFLSGLAAVKTRRRNGDVASSPSRRGGEFATASSQRRRRCGVTGAASSGTL